MRRATLAIVVALLVGPSAAVAVPNLIDYQGALTDAAGNPVSGQRDIRFAFYDAQDRGTLLWQETQAITVQDGVYSTALGSVNAFPDGLWDASQLWLGVEVGDDDELAPRARIVAVPYARKAQRAETAGVADTLAGGVFPAGAMVVSVRENDPAMLAAGYVAVGRVACRSLDSWSATSTVDVPTGRHLHTAVWAGDRMIIWGGDGPEGKLLSGSLYDPASDSVYVSVPDFTCKIDRRSGRAIWEIGFGTGNCDSISLIEEYLVINDGGSLVLCDAARGEILAKYGPPACQLFDDRTTIVDGQLRAKDFDGALYTLALPVPATSPAAETKQ